MPESTLRTVVALMICWGMMIAGPALSQNEGPETESFEPESSETESSATASGTEDSQISDEITVTARQEEETLQDVPATVSVLTDSQIEAVGVQRAEDFVKLVPGVSMVNAAEVGDTQVNIRGINGSRDAENSFAFIVDGILMTNPAAFNREYSTLRQIEVMKGPQGALYGRNAAAGAMIVTTREPGDEAEGEIKLSLAEDSTYYGALNLGGPIGDSGRHRYQFAADWRTSDGFYFNEFQNDDVVDDFQSYNVSGRLLFEANDRTRWDFKARYGEVDAAAITFNAAFALPDFASVLGLPEFFEDVNEHQFVFQGNIDPQNDQEALELSARVEHELEWGELAAWVLYSDIENTLSADGTSGAFGFFNTEPNCIASTAQLFNSGVVLPFPQILAPTPADSIFGPYTPTTCDGTQFQLRNQEDISFELRLSGEANDRLRWQAGVYYLNIDREVGVNLGIDTGQGVVEQLFVPQNGANPTEQLVHDNFETDVYALFGALRYDVDDDVELSLALRYDSEQRDVTNLVPTDARTQFVDFSLDGQFTGGAPLNPGLDPSLNPSGSIAPKSETFDELQPKVSLTWDATDNLTLYGSWGVGFKSGGFNNQGSNATVNLFFNTLLGTDLIIDDQFDEETSSALELGFKSNVGPNAYIEGAIYQTDVDDMQFFEFLVGPFGLLRVVSNIDEVEIRGAEVGFNLRVNNYLSLYSGINFVNSEILANTSRPATVGNESPYTPEYTGNLALDFSKPISDRMIFTASAYFTLVGQTWFHTVQDEERVTLFNAFFPGLGVGDYSLTRRDAYEKLDLRVGFSTERWSATLFVDNLTDEEYLEEVITAPEFGGSFIHPGRLRRAGIEVGFRF
ncbi:MAG: TonB-dependent receptor [Acidobacteriota bacterium]